MKVIVYVSLTCTQIEFIKEELSMEEAAVRLVQAKKIKDSCKNIENRDRRSVLFNLILSKHKQLLDPLDTDVKVIETELLEYVKRKIDYFPK